MKRPKFLRNSAYFTRTTKLYATTAPPSTVTIETDAPGERDDEQLKGRAARHFHPSQRELSLPKGE